MVRYVVFTWVPESILDEWNEWHNGVHIPHVLTAPQIQAVRKYRIGPAEFPGDWQPQYATMYELESVEAFDAYRNGPGPAIRAEYDAKYGNVGRIARLVLGGEVDLGAGARKIDRGDRS
jgi:hypothetical protein